MPAPVTAWDAMAASLRSTPVREGLPTPLHAADAAPSLQVHAVAASPLRRLAA